MGLRGHRILLRAAAVGTGGLPAMTMDHAFTLPVFSLVSLVSIPQFAVDRPFLPLC